MMQNISLQRPRAVFEKQHQGQLPRSRPYHKYTRTLPHSSSARSSTPLTFRTLPIPQQIKQYCSLYNIELKPDVFDCCNQFFWLSIENTFFLWRYKHIHKWGQYSSDPQMLLVVTFNQRIRTAQIGQVIGYQFNSLSDLQLLAIVLTNKIVFFSYVQEKQTFQNMKMEVITNNQIINDIVFAYGRIYYCGTHGTLKTVFNKPRLFRKQTRLVMKSSSWVKDTINNSILFWKVHLTCSHLMIMNTKAYFIVQKHYPTSKLAMNLLFKGKEPVQRSLKIFDISTNTLLKEIEQSLLLQRIRIHCGRSKQLMMGIKVIGLFQNNNKLGLSLSCGAFALLNSQGLLIQDVYFIPLVHSKGIIGQQISRQLDIMQTDSSLGFENLSYFNKCGLAYTSSNSIDISPFSLPYFDLIKMRQLKSNNLQYQNTIFDSPQQWICLTFSHVIQLKRLRIQDILLVYLQIMYQQRILRKNISLTQHPFLHLCHLFGTINICVRLMQIICNTNLEVQLLKQVYQRTKTEIFQFQFQSLPNLQSKQTSSNVIININQHIIKIAAQVLNYLQSKDLSTELDTLWKSVLEYFNQIYSLVKHLTVTECITHYKLIDEVKYKLQCFKRLLIIKSLELNPNDINNTNDNSISVSMSMSINQKDNIPPISLRQKYDSNTPILISRTKHLIDKIYTLLEVSLLIRIDSREDNQPTIHEILTENRARDILRFRILKDVNSITSPDTKLTLEKLSKTFPELLNESDQIFNEYILNDNKNHDNIRLSSNFSIESIVPAVSNQRIEIIRQYFYKRKQLYEYIVLLLQRMKYLQIEKHKLKQSNNKYYPFAEYDNLQKSIKLEQLEENWLKVVESYEQSLRDYIIEIKQSKILNRLEFLLHYIRSLEIEPITLFTQQILEEQGLPHMIRIFKERNEKVELKPKTLYQFK